MGFIISFLTISNSILYRKQYEEVGNEKVEKMIQGQRVFRGRKYRLPKVCQERKPATQTTDMTVL